MHLTPFSQFSFRWPQSTIPTFKILSAECLQKTRIGEQLSLVRFVQPAPSKKKKTFNALYHFWMLIFHWILEERVKVSWPLSLREAIVHYYLFEYFQDDLIVVLTNSVIIWTCVCFIF